jgi:23S rRNA pseudoU1915 N3-methylase RlmH
MKIQDLILEIKEKHLGKTELEDYSSMLDVLCAEYELELAEIEKAEAMFLANCQEKTRNGAERIWDASEQGQKEIELKRQLKSASKLASSVKTRIYQHLNV